MTEVTPLSPMGENPYRNLLQERTVQESFSIRAFSNWLIGAESPEDNWGLEYDEPKWIQETHNRHQGRCFLCGTGPSLATQLELLRRMKEEYFFTCNRMKLWGDFPVQPFVHCVTEPQPFLEWGQHIVPIYDNPTAMNRIGCTWWPVRVPGWLWLPKAPEEIQIRWQGFQGFSDRFCPLPTGWASPLTISQLAAWMGFREFYFLGIDTTQQGQAWDVKGGRTLQPRNIRSILECFDRARIDIELKGGKVYDCTPGGRVNQEGILPYVPLEDVLAKRVLRLS